MPLGTPPLPPLRFQLPPEESPLSPAGSLCPFRTIIPLICTNKPESRSTGGKKKKGLADPPPSRNQAGLEANKGPPFHLSEAAATPDTGHNIQPGDEKRCGGRHWLMGPSKPRFFKGIFAAPGDFSFRERRGGIQPPPRRRPADTKSNVKTSRLAGFIWPDLASPPSDLPPIDFTPFFFKGSLAGSAGSQSARPARRPFALPPPSRGRLEGTGLPLPAIRKSRRGCGPAQLEQPSSGGGGGRRASEGGEGRGGPAGLAKKRFYALTSGAKEDTGVRGKTRRSGRARERGSGSGSAATFFPSFLRRAGLLWAVFLLFFFAPITPPTWLPRFREDASPAASKGVGSSAWRAENFGGLRSGGGLPGESLETGSTPASVPSSGHG